MNNVTVACTFFSGFEGLYAMSKNLILTELHRIKGVDRNSRQIGMPAFVAPRAVMGHGSSVPVPCHLPSLSDLHILVDGQAVFWHTVR